MALLDLHLPGKSGIELLETLKASQPGIEAILLTAPRQHRHRHPGDERGAYDYLAKPFHLPELEIHIQKAFEKRQLAHRQWQLSEQLRYESPRYRLIGSSPAMHASCR